MKYVVEQDLSFQTVAVTDHTTFTRCVMVDTAITSAGYGVNIENPVDATGCTVNGVLVI